MIGQPGPNFQHVGQPSQSVKGCQNQGDMGKETRRAARIVTSQAEATEVEKMLLIVSTRPSFQGHVNV